MFTLNLSEKALQKSRKNPMLDKLIMNLRVAYARLWVRLIGGNREPEWLVAEMIIPLLTLSAYIYLYRFIQAPPEFTGFVILGGTVLAFWTNVLWNMSAQFYWEKETGTLEVYLVAPISRMAILLGMALGGFVNTTLRAIAIIVAGILIFQVPFALRDPISAFVLFFLTIVALYGLGMMFASLFMLYGREAWHTANLLQEPVQFLSGSFYPTAGLGPLVSILSSLIPLSFGLDGMRKVVVLGGGIAEAWIDIVALLVFVAILMPLARFALHYMENLGKREGRLTLRWQ